MPVLNGVKGLSDLPGYERIARIGQAWEEPLVLRGSAARRLAKRILDKSPIDHTLPSLCSPPPSDLDLLFQTDQSSRIAEIVSEIRDEAPIFQAVRVESTSFPRVEGLLEKLEEHVTCPIFGIALPAFDPEGFRDPTGVGLEELANGNLSFKLSDTALLHPESLDDDVRFQIYCACLVFFKSMLEHSKGEWDPGDVLAFCSKNEEFVTQLMQGPEAEYTQTRLLSLAYSIRAIGGQQVFSHFLSPILPSDISAAVYGGRLDSPLFHLAKSDFFTTEVDWGAADTSELGEQVDLSDCLVVAESPTVPVSPLLDIDQGAFMECLVPLSDHITGGLALANSDYCAILKVNVQVGKEAKTVWLPAFCDLDVRQEHLNLRIPLDDIYDMQRVLRANIGPSSIRLRAFLLADYPAEAG